MIKDSADILPFSDRARSLREVNRSGSHQSNPVPWKDKTDDTSGAVPDDSNDDARERVLRHLIRLHGLVG